MTHTNVEHNVDFIEQHERAVVKQALQAVAALHDALALKRETALPLLPETWAAVIELEDEIGSLKLKLLRSPQTGQLTFPGMDHPSSTVDHPDGHHGVSAVVTAHPA